MAADKYVLRGITDADIEECADLACDTFLQSEPMTSTKPRNRDLYRKFVVASTTETAKQGLGWVAVDEHTNKIVSFLLVMDYDTPPEGLGLENILEDCADVCHALETCEVQYHNLVSSSEGKLPTIETGTHLHWWMGGTHISAAGKGLSKQLRVKSLEMARKAGFKAVVSECTNKATQHICSQHFGFEAVLFVDYATLGYANLAALSEQHGGIRVMQLLL